MGEQIPEEWIIGFFEGEGCFSHGIDGGGNKRPRFSVSQNEKDIITKIQHQLGIGRIYIKKPRGNSKMAWTLEMKSYNDCWKLYAFITGRLHTNHKKEQFAKWKKLLRGFLLKKRRWNSEEETELLKLIKEGYDYGQISKKLKRSVLSVKARNWTKFHLRIKKRMVKK